MTDHTPLTERPAEWKPSWSRLRDDRFFDEVRLDPVTPGPDAPYLRLVTVLRYKTSGMSGDEWRTSVVWEQSPDAKTWEPYDGGYLNIETGLKAFFPGIYTSHRKWWGSLYVGIDFYRKGELLYRATMDGNPAPLLAQAGHAPWAEVHAGENCGGMPKGWEAKCFQNGCSRDAQAVVMLKQRFDSSGRARSSVQTWSKATPDVECRAFCNAHRRRGDCGLDDADANYLHVSGTPLDGETGSKHFASPAVQVVVDLTRTGIPTTDPTESPDE
jgi:hypothetical protein